MAVLFPTPVGYTLNPAHQAEMIQGFLNIEAAEGSTNGRLTQAQMADYQQKHANMTDANTAVANYLSTNFNYLAQVGNHDNTISVDDLVQLQHSLPTMPTVNNPTLPDGWPDTTGTGTTGSPAYVPVYIPVPVGTTGTSPYSYNPYGTTTSTNPYGTLGSTYGSYTPSTSGQSMPQLMISLLQQMMQMIQSYI